MMTPELLQEIKDSIEQCKWYSAIGLSPGTWLPALVDEVERLTADNERLQAAIVSWKKEEEDWIADNARLQAELDEVRREE